MIVMDELLEIIAEMTARMPTDTLMHLADEIQSIDDVSELYTIQFNPNLRSLCNRFLNTCESLNCSTTVIASTLRGACSVVSVLNQRTAVNLVWTGPQTEYISIRHTESVLTEMIYSARNQLFMVSFVAYHAPAILGALHNALERGVRVRMLLEASKNQGGRQVDHDSLGLMQRALPEIELFQWMQRNAKGVVHAKCAVTDAERLFVTSANISEAALEHNIEAGVLITGGEAPKQMMRHLQALIDTRVIVPFET